jgi:hypothetical protein
MVGIRNNNKFSQFITYLQVVPTEINFILLVYHRPEQLGMVLKLLNILLPKHGMSYQTTLDWKILLNNSKT